MAKGNNQKLKLLYLSRIFCEETDEEHGLTMPQIIQRLQNNDINADRKTLYLDFEELRNFGLDIVSQQNGRNYTYHLVSRDFELAELKLLVDSVQSSKFITEKKSKALIKKLESLVSRYDAVKLQRQVLISGRIKTMNESIYYNVDRIHDALNFNKKIRFRYFRWNTDKEEELRKNGDWYIVSPWYLRWDDENYYLLAYDSESNSLKHYRVDKMKTIQSLDEEREGKELIDSINVNDYGNTLFGMYGGEIERVTLECENSMVGVLIDRFGKDILITKTDSGHFSTTFEASISEQFLGWVTGLGNKVKIVSPESVRLKMKSLLKDLTELY